MEAKLHIFTSAAVNYLPKVRMLCRSIRRHHPEAMIHLALADERPGWLGNDGEPFDEIHEMRSLGIPGWRSWSFMHNIVELSTAIKPFVLRRLLERPDCAKALYFDPDMVLFSRVDDILATLDAANLALTPHQNKPEQSLEAILDNEVTSLRMGIFNLGFIGVRNTPEAHRFAGWWAERTYLLCRAEPHNGLFTDQKWIDFAPVFFDGVAILKSSRHNVATWNLTTRSLTGDLASGFRVDGEPLAFYHFTGFDSGAHRVMAVKNAAGNMTVQELIAWYERETAASRGDPVNDWPWAYGRFSDGTPIQAHHRWLYRENKDLQSAFPDPYYAGTERLSLPEWCRTEGRLRFPQFFGKDGGSAKFAPYPGGRTSVSPLAAVKLGLLMFAPRGGRSLRERLFRLLRREGLAGIARRIRRPVRRGHA
ncbi:MAG TPA: glycosyl transferase [Usitatibacter sp.]|nr:glycosyl transferase [Usitatibacter sp.]